MSDSWVQWQHAVARFIYITVTSVKKLFYAEMITIDTEYPLCILFVRALK